MELVFREHAVERMKDRRISVQNVRAVLEKPDGVIPQSRDKFIYHRAIKGRKDNDVAVVAVAEREVGFEVLTVMVNFEVHDERTKH